MNQVNMLRICQSESLNSLVIKVAFNYMAACSHYIMCKPKGTMMLDFNMLFVGTASSWPINLLELC